MATVRVLRLIVVPAVTGIYHDQLVIGSAVEISDQCRSLAEKVGFPSAEVPALDPRGYAILDWYDELTASGSIDDPIWRRDPDFAFYLALFGSVAAYSVDHNEAVAYC